MAYLIGFLGLVIILNVWAIIRWKSSGMSHPDRSPRFDMACLMLLALAGTLGEFIRQRYENNPIAILICSVLMAPVGIAALYYVWRLIRAYRQTKIS